MVRNLVVLGDNLAVSQTKFAVSITTAEVEGKVELLQIMGSFSVAFYGADDAYTIQCLRQSSFYS